MGHVGVGAAIRSSSVQEAPMPTSPGHFRPVAPRVQWAGVGVLPFLLLPGSGAALQDAPTCPAPSRGEACEIRTFQLDLADRRLQITDVASGSVMVEGWDGEEARVQARITARSRLGRSPASILEEVELQAGDGRIRAAGPEGLLGGTSWSVSYWIQVPRGTELELDVTNGRIQVQQVEGPVAATSTNGRIRLDHVDGWVRARTTNGSVDVGFREGARLRESVQVEGTNGSITLTVPQSLDATLRASTTNGSIGGDLPLDTSGQRGGRQATATLGAGGPEILLRTTNGSIRIRTP